MKIGVIEIMPKGHYTLAETVARVYASDIDNQIIIFTSKAGENNLSPLKKRYKNINIEVVDQDVSIEKYLKYINDSNLDKAYIITLDSYYSEFSKINFKFPIYLFIHNIYLWFDLSFISNLKRCIEEIKNKPSIFHYWIKRNFIQTLTKKRIRAEILRSGGKFVVLNGNLTKELKKFTSENTIEEIPFSIYDDELNDNSIENKLFRICVPGMLSVSRRDYFSLFNTMRATPKFYKDKIEIDLLGGVSESENGASVLKVAKELIEEGFNIRVYEKTLVPLKEFDEELSKADFILGNMHVIMDVYNVYGKSKDSGIMYTMVKAAKPGFLPIGYSILPELEDSTLMFSDYSDLSNQIQNLISNKEQLDLRRRNAKKNSLEFSPEKIYKRLRDK